MICVKLNGGLGNQMFQYACGKALAHKHQTTLILDTTLLTMHQEGVTQRLLNLDIFTLLINIADDADLVKLKPLFYKIINTLLIKAGVGGIQTSKYFVERGFAYNNSINKAGPNCYLSGYWQSYLYFNNVEPIIRTDFSFKHKLDEKNKSRADNINEKNAVSLHIRRTDFTDKKFLDFHGTCSIDYYKRAIGYIADKITDPYFFIFSDDIEWARENLNLDYPCYFVSGNTGKKNYIDMQLMSLCKHNIIANSSFSWWGAWLNSNNDKIVVAPKQWFTNTGLNEQTKDLIPKNWVRL